MRKYLHLFFCLLVFFIDSGCNSINHKSSSGFDDFIDLTNRNLENALYNKKQGLIEYLTGIQKLSVQVKSDLVLTSFFKVKNDYYLLQKDKIDIPEKLKGSVNSLKSSINRHYLASYLHFYDMLFINNKGDIFYTIRKESDYHTNINDSLYIDIAFTKKLFESPAESFVDFQFYKQSGMPSAFFIEPIFEDGKLLGWIVLQLSVDKINHMFIDDNNLGQTGEIVLVNEDHYLLTESRFINRESILKQKLPDKNIEYKFKEKKGCKKVIDYRGKEVLSAFETFSFMNSDWLLIAKKDKSEIINDFYRINKEIITKEIVQKIKSNGNKNLINKEQFNAQQDLKTVFIDDYKRSDSSNVLFTQGVSTCTSVCFTYKEQFSYMAHISPYDAIYNSNRSDLLKTVMDKIELFEIPDSDKNAISIYVIFTNFRSLENILVKLLDNNYSLNQIKVAYNGFADYANVYCEGKNKVWVNWHLKSGEVVSQNVDNELNIQQLIFY